MRDWTNYKGIIFGMAFKFSPNKQEMEDLVGEGFVCFMEVIEEEKKYGLCCPFEAALSNHIRQHFLNMIEKKKALKRTGEELSFAEMEEMLGRDPRKMLEKYVSLSKEMKEVVDVILSAPNEFIDLIRHNDFKIGLSKYLRKYKGWSTSDVKKFWTEFKEKESEGE